jgi:large subunit ribosomal protein L15
MLRLNNISAQPGSVTKRKRIGRGAGSGWGTQAGKGHKGQLARSGGSVHPSFEGGQTPLYRRLPKRGFNNVDFQVSRAVLNISDLDKLAGLGEISLESLRSGRKLKGRYDRLTILGTGEVTKAVKIKAHKVTPAALEKIQAAGGSVEIIAS